MKTLLVVCFFFVFENCALLGLCCSAGSVEVGRAPAYTPRVVVAPTSTEVVRAQEFLDSYKKNHPSEVSKLVRQYGVDQVDRHLIRRHLRTTSRHIEHLRHVLEYQIKEESVEKKEESKK